jgi:Potential Queuosine, Q, salvage protein family
MRKGDGVPDLVREACAWVMERAGSVRIEDEGIEAYAAALPAPGQLPPPDPATCFGAAGDGTEGDRESRAAFVICLDAINFGSGWWPTIRRRPGHSGYFTVAAGMTERFRREGPWTAAELAELDAAAIAAVLGQDPAHPLLAEFAASLRDVGVRVGAEHGGSFAAVADAAGGSAVALADLLAGWDAFDDVSPYREREVPFFKRAQIAAADLDRAGVVSFADRDRLTAFADNLVPHVLRVDGVLRLDPGLTAAIEAGGLLEHGSEPEVELRAAAVHAVELLAAASGGRLVPAEVDAALWNRGRERRYKSLPRPRSRNTAY